jgi:hypothetical protein
MTVLVPLCAAMSLGLAALLAEYVKAPMDLYRGSAGRDAGHTSKIIVDERTRSILPLLNLDPQKGERPRIGSRL